VIVPAGLAFSNFVTVAILIAALYFTREILVPIALAVLLSFVLARRQVFPALAPTALVVCRRDCRSRADCCPLPRHNGHGAGESTGERLAALSNYLGEKVHNLRDVWDRQDY
jgi:hypothetical protein